MTVAEKLHELACELLPCLLPETQFGVHHCEYPMKRSHPKEFWCSNCSLRPAAEDALRKAYDFGADGLLELRQKWCELVARANKLSGELEELRKYIEGGA